jgi:hypothetical protein
MAESAVLGFAAASSLMHYKKPISVKGWDELDGKLLGFKRSLVYHNKESKLVLKDLLRPDRASFFTEIHRYYVAYTLGLAPRIIGFFWAPGRGQILSEYYGPSLRQTVICPTSKSTDSAVKRALAKYMAAQLIQYPLLQTRDTTFANILIKDGWVYADRVMRDFEIVFCDWGAFK